MNHGFSEFVVGGILVAPLVPQAIIALALFLLARPLGRLAVFETTFANPPLVAVCLYVVILAGVMLMY